MESRDTLATEDLDDRRLITRRQLQDLLPVSAMTIWRWEQEGRLPKHVTIGGRSFWRRSEVLRFIDEQTQDG